MHLDDVRVAAAHHELELAEEEELLLARHVRVRALRRDRRLPPLHAAHLAEGAAAEQRVGVAEPAQVDVRHLLLLQPLHPPLLELHEARHRRRARAHVVERHGAGGQLVGVRVVAAEERLRRRHFIGEGIVVRLVRHGVRLLVGERVLGHERREPPLTAARVRHEARALVALGVVWNAVELSRRHRHRTRRQLVRLRVAVGDNIHGDALGRRLHRGRSGYGVARRATCALRRGGRGYGEPGQTQTSNLPGSYSIIRRTRIL